MSSNSGTASLSDSSESLSSCEQMSSNSGIASLPDRAKMQSSIGKKEESREKFQNLTSSTLTICNKFSRKELVITREKKLLFPIKETADAEISIEKLPEQMGVTVDHEKLSFKKFFTKQMQDYPQYIYERFLYQKVMQQLSKTDGKQELVEPQLKQPHELKHFSIISPFDQNKMLTDGHQDSERIALLFDMLISLAPAVILPQQSEIVPSYVKMNDILLSLNLDQFSEVCVHTHGIYDVMIIACHGMYSDVVKMPLIYETLDNTKFMTTFANLLCSVNF